MRKSNRFEISPRFELCLGFTVTRFHPYYGRKNGRFFGFEYCLRERILALFASVFRFLSWKYDFSVLNSVSVSCFWFISVVVNKGSYMFYAFLAIW